MARLTTPAERPPVMAEGESDPALQLLVQNAEAASSEALADLERRATAYLHAGYPLHLRGPAGSGNGAGVGLPRGPALCNREMLAEAFYRELVLKNTVTLKVGRARIPLYPTPRARSHHQPMCV